MINLAVTTYESEGLMLSKRVTTTSPNILSVLLDKVIQRKTKGLPVFNLSAGTPDLPPDDHVMKALATAAEQCANYKYAISDQSELVDTVRAWYSRRFNVALTTDEVTSVYGTQEGMAHIFFTLCDPGDVVLLPSPLYPVFLSGVEIAGAKPVFMPMLRENNYLIDLDAIPREVAEKAKVIVASYPNNPTTVAAPDEFYEKLVWFAKKYNIFVIHDNAYGELVLEGTPGRSFLEFDGAKDIGIEFNSLSKSYNLTGMRVSFALGNSRVITAFKAFRSQIDYGLFPASQKAAIAALTGNQDILERNRSAYRSRRDLLTSGLRGIGWPVEDCYNTMFTWYSIPKGYGDDTAFAMELLDKTGVTLVPGSSFGKEGKGFVRIALVQQEDRLKEAIDAIGKAGII